MTHGNRTQREQRGLILTLLRAVYYVSSILKELVQFQSSRSIDPWVGLKSSTCQNDFKCFCLRNLFRLLIEFFQLISFQFGHRGERFVCFLFMHDFTQQMKESALLLGWDHAAGDHWLPSHVAKQFWHFYPKLHRSNYGGTCTKWSITSSRPEWLSGNVNL